MVTIAAFAVLVVGAVVGLLTGFSIGTTRTQAALKLARYSDAIALADDLVKTPDALDLRDRASKLLAAHRSANLDQEK
ncbi:hypothetical protein [Paractinoplanes maris]|uniref:hypothetical protein n=1 Tax=Paractinoplanes maris TaxID=1734446 RepID=UPI0020205BCA|nr:hypothetical protein [Actinoplanes maris]